MSDLVGNPEDRFSRVAADVILNKNTSFCQETSNLTELQILIGQLLNGLRLDKTNPEWCSKEPDDFMWIDYESQCKIRRGCNLISS